MEQSHLRRRRLENANQATFKVEGCKIKSKKNGVEVLNSSGKTFFLMGYRLTVLITLYIMHTGIN